MNLLNKSLLLFCFPMDSNRNARKLKEPQTISIYWFYLLWNHVATSSKSKLFVTYTFRAAVLRRYCTFVSPYSYWWLIIKKRGWKLYRSPNPNPRGVRKCNSAVLFSSPPSWTSFSFLAPKISFFETSH